MKLTTKLIVYSIIFLAGSFLIGLFGSGFTFKPSPSGTIFQSQKTSRPKFEFYSMSFCPYSNQVETIISPVFKLLSTSVDFVPHYIFNQINNLSAVCNNRTGVVSQCSNYVQKKYFPDLETCRKTITNSLSKCLDEKNYIKSLDGTLYASLNGRQESNQNIREICAWNQLNNDKTSWWNFIKLVNQNCTFSNADTCWEDQGKQSGLDTNKITDCFNKETFNIIKKEVEQTQSLKINTSPSIMINGVRYPPENSFSADSDGNLVIGKKSIPQDKYRSPNAIKEAICASFTHPPIECKTILSDSEVTSPSVAYCIF